MFIEKIDDELIEEIQQEMDEEFDQAYALWDEEYIDLNRDDIEDMLRSEILEHYHRIPYYKLKERIYMEYPFIKEKELALDPWSKMIYNKVENEETNIKYTEIFINVFTNINLQDWQKLDKSERRIVKQLLKEITSFYHNQLDTVDIVFLLLLTEEDLFDF